MTEKVVIKQFLIRIELQIEGRMGTQQLPPACQSGRPMGLVSCLCDLSLVSAPLFEVRQSRFQLDAKSKIHFAPSLPSADVATSFFDVERKATAAQLSQTFGK